MVLQGLIGARFTDSSLAFTPYLPAGVSHLTLRSLNYRGRKLNITITGRGNKIKRFSIDGKIAANDIDEKLPAGAHNILIELEK